MEIAIENVPAVAGQVVVCPDVSGSMRSPVTGARRGATTAVRCIDVAALMAAGVAVAFAPTASAAPTPVSQATGRFLSGSIGGTDLDKLVAVKGESAANNGGCRSTRRPRNA